MILIEQTLGGDHRFELRIDVLDFVVAHWGYEERRAVAELWKTGKISDQLLALHQFALAVEKGSKKPLDPLGQPG